MGLVAALRPDDWLLPVHRNLAVFTGTGARPRRPVPPAPRAAGGYTGGRDRTFHFGTLDHHVVGMISHLGAMAPVADGLALAARLRGATGWPRCWSATAPPARATSTRR